MIKPGTLIKLVSVEKGETTGRIYSPYFHFYETPDKRRWYRTIALGDVFMYIESENDPEHKDFRYWNQSEPILRHWFLTKDNKKVFINNFLTTSDFMKMIIEHFEIIL